MRILVFGDSIGQGLYDGRGGWVQRLWQDQLDSATADLRGDTPFIFNLSISGDTSDNVLQRLGAETQARANGEEIFFILAIGTNDSRLQKGQPIITPEAFRENLEKIITAAQQYSHLIMLVGLPAVWESMTNPWTYDPDNLVWTNERVKLFEDQIKNAASDHSLTFVPLHQNFMRRVESNDNILTDGLHPNDAGHEIIYESVKPLLLELI